MATIALSSILKILFWILILIKDADGSVCTDATTNKIDICSAKTVVQDQTTHNILLTVSSTQECQCRLSIQNHNETLMVLFKKYEEIDNNVPTEHYCGAVVNFEKNGERIWRLHCKLGSNTVLNYPTPANTDILIYSESVFGTLKDGYCIDIVKLDNTKNNILTLQCGFNVSHTTTTSTTYVPVITTTASLPVIATTASLPVIATTTTTTAGFVTSPIPTTTTTNLNTSPKITTKTSFATSQNTGPGGTVLSTISSTHQLTSTQDMSVPFTTLSDNVTLETNSTDFNATLVAKQDDPVNWELYVALGASLFVLIIVIIVVVIVCIRCRKTNHDAVNSDDKGFLHSKTDNGSEGDNSLNISNDSKQSRTNITKDSSDHLIEVKTSKYNRFDIKSNERSVTNKTRRKLPSLTDSRSRSSTKAEKKDKNDKNKLQMNMMKNTVVTFTATIIDKLDEKPETINGTNEKSKMNTYDTIFASKYKVKQEEFERVPKNRIGYLYYYNSKDI